MKRPTASGFRVRWATESDLPGIRTVGMTTWPQTYGFAGEDYISSGLARWWSTEALSASLRDTEMMVAVDERDVVVGVGNVDLRCSPPVIWKLYVLPETHGRGVGSAILDGLIHRVGDQPVQLEYVAGNQSAARFYARRGFTEIRREPGEQPGWPDLVWAERPSAVRGGDRPRTGRGPESGDRREAFRALHVPGRPLLLANVWDGGTARLAQACGLPAIATTSAGISWAHGVPDGAHLSREQALAAIGRIIERTDLPVSADLEHGYGPGPEQVAVTVAAAAQLGVAGINLEDTTPDPPGGAPALRPVTDQQGRIAAARAASGPELFLNARIDTFLLGAAELTDTVRRAHAYVEAGADGVFVPGLADPDSISELVAALDAPVNVMVGPDASLQELAELGVARVSLGASLALTAYQSFAMAVATMVGTSDTIDHSWVGSVLQSVERTPPNPSRGQP